MDLDDHDQREEPSRRLDRSGYRVEFDGAFERWLPYYLPQWASRERTRARWDAGGLILTADQQPWAPEYDGPLRVTNLQTGVRSGPVGSSSGQLRFRDDLAVSEEQPTERVYTPSSGLVEIRARAIAEANCMVALWMIGFGEAPEQSGEICVMEIFGNEITPTSAKVGMGIHPWHDPSLTDDFETIELTGDATDWHTYSVTWSADRTSHYIDDLPVKSSAQAPTYPMQLMLSLYEFEPGGEYPKRFDVDYVRGYSTRETSGTPGR